MNHLNAKLYRAAARTFEELAFLLPSALLSEAQTGAEADVALEVGFEGPVKGTLVVGLSGPVLRLALRNMLGERAEDLSEAEQHEALAEIASIICGNVLSVLTPHTVFLLDRPKPLDPTRFMRCFPGAVGNGHPAAEAHLGIAEGRADVLLYLDPPSHPPGTTLIG
jgi:hypothetical protein